MTESVEERLESIEQRNLRVEADKAWETSLFRVILISLITYTITSFVFFALGVVDFWFNAIIPTVGYFLSTQSIPVVKKWWIARRYKTDECA